MAVTTSLRAAVKNVGMQLEAILHIVLNFQADRACFNGGETGANFGLSSDILSEILLHTQLKVHATANTKAKQ